LVEPVWGEFLCGTRGRAAGNNYGSKKQLPNLESSGCKSMNSLYSNIYFIKHDQSKQLQWLKCFISRNLLQ